jgi:hypothetical protein
VCHSQTSDEAISNAERLAIEVIADRIAPGELPSSSLGVSFTLADEHLDRRKRGEFLSTRRGSAGE